ncbi:hypothetical protein FDF31_10280 [Clostridium sporogenes]|uniref:hypothetical protein n=1 Tax=Clostridium sp. LCP25S3_F8 TaxID=3438751 RepID=UPI0013CFEA3B|nr:hypothetical protein [Clostridium sporogenes]NFS25997.1 hypothetical protein [Clostridium sporogenes]
MLNKIYQIYYIGISDFLDRIRSKNILIITLLMVYISYLFFPQNNSSFYYTLNYSYEDFFYRGVYNSVWIGWVATVAFISVVTLIGFYFVRNSIKREKELLIGEITASIGVKSWIFIFGKSFGNFLFLILQMLVVILTTIIMQFVRGESYYFEPIKLLTPFLILAIPACFITAVIAIAFDTTPFLSSSSGNIVYFFLWALIGAASVGKKISPLRDVFGMDTTAKIILEQLRNNFKEFQNINSVSLGNHGPLNGNVKIFTMNTANISRNVLLGRLFWILMGVLLLFLVSMSFKRTFLLKTKRLDNNKKTTKEVNCNYNKKIVLSEIFENTIYSNNLSIIKSEIKIIFALPKLWWYIIIILCSIGVFFVEGDMLYKFLIPVIWILPIFIWSKLGSIQMNFNMEEYLFTYKNYRNKQLLNSIITGILFTIFINIGVIIKFAMLNNFLAICYILMATFFVNVLGIFIENATGSSTAFEIIYIILWYVGILNGLMSLDFLGLTQKAASAHIPIIFLVIGVALLIASIIIKNNRIRKLYN